MAEEAIESKVKEVKIELPEDYKVPDEVEPGDDFDELVRVRLSDDGTCLYVEAVGGIPTAHEKDELDQKEQADADYTDNANSESQKDHGDTSFGGQIYNIVKGQGN